MASEGELELLRELREVIRGMIKEAEDAEHRRLRGLLEQVADAHQFTEHLAKLGDADHPYPDVRRIHAVHKGFLFIADAKDAKSQRLVDSREQVASYLSSVRKRIDAGMTTFAVFAIATNAREAAVEWHGALPGMIASAGLDAEGPQLVVRSESTLYVMMILWKKK